MSQGHRRKVTRLLIDEVDERARQAVDETRDWLAQRYPRVLAEHPWLAEYGPPEALEGRIGVTMYLKQAEEELAACEGCTGLGSCPLTPRGEVSVLSVMRSAFSEDHPERDLEGRPTIERTHRPCRYSVAEADEKRIADLLERARIPARVARALAGPLEETEVVKAAREWATSLPGPQGEPHHYPATLVGSPNLVFVGGVGRGKTLAACLALREGMRRTFAPGRFWSVARLLDALRPDDHEDRFSLEDVAETPILLLDDLGLERASDWVRERIDLLVDIRYQAMLPTIVTTNLARKELAETLGERVTSRLLEGALVLVAEGPDRRVPA